MFNNSKDSSSSYSFFKDDDEQQQPQNSYGMDDSAPEKGDADDGGLGFDSSNFMGMNAVQRLIIAFLFLMMVCVLGAMFLLVTGSLYLPV